MSEVHPPEGHVLRCALGDTNLFHARPDMPESNYSGNFFLWKEKEGAQPKVYMNFLKSNMKFIDFTWEIL